MWALMDVLRMIEALSFKSGSAFWIVKYAPLKLMSMMPSNSSSVTASTGANLPTPALTKSTSIWPNFSCTAANSSSISARLEASERTAKTSPPISRAAASSVRWSRPVMTTRAPCSLNSLAVAKPMPELPPVMTATLPANLPIEILLILTVLFVQSPRCLRHRKPHSYLERLFQNASKKLVQHRERDLHDILQRLAIPRRLRHQLQSLQAAIEEARDGAEVAPALDLARLLPAQQRTVKSLLGGGYIVARLGRGLLTAAG